MTDQQVTTNQLISELGNIRWILKGGRSLSFTTRTRLESRQGHIGFVLRQRGLSQEAVEAIR